MSIFGKPKPAKPVDVINSGLRSGCASATFKISRSDAVRVRQAERRGGQAAGLVVVLQILRERQAAGPNR